MPMTSDTTIYTADHTEIITADGSQMIEEIDVITDIVNENIDVDITRGEE